MREPLLRLAGEARQAASAAHDAHRVQSLALGQDGETVLRALSGAGRQLELLAAQLERLAAEAPSAGQKGC